MKVISFINNKGGVGKTMSAVTVAHMLATLHNKRVLIIDLDPQGNTSALYSDMDAFSILKSLLEGNYNFNIEYSLENLLLDRDIDIHKCVKNTAYEGLDIIPTLLTLSQCEEALRASIGSPQQFRLKNHLDKIADEYDFCILDCSPSVSLTNINGLVASDKVYIPCRSDLFSTIGAAITLPVMEQVRTYSPNLNFGGIFFTHWESKIVDRAALDLLHQYMGDKIIPITIRKSKLAEEMTYAQVPLLVYDDVKGYSKITHDYMRLTEYILNNV